MKLLGMRPQVPEESKLPGSGRSVLASQCLSPISSFCSVFSWGISIDVFFNNNYFKLENRENRRFFFFEYSIYVSPFRNSKH